MEQVFDVEQPKDVKRPKDVEQAQRGGTGPKINHTFSAEVEQAQRGVTEERSAILGCF